MVELSSRDRMHVGINKLLWLVCVVLIFINMSHDLRATPMIGAVEPANGSYEENEHRTERQI